MGETSYPYADGEGPVTDARYEQLMGPTMGCGRLPEDDNLVAYNTKLVLGDGSGRQVKIRPSSAAIVRGFAWESDSAGLIVPIEANTTGKLRIDLVTLRLNRDDDFKVRVHVIKGATGSSASAATEPTPVQRIAADGVYDWPIGAVKVVSSTTAGQPLLQDVDVTRRDHYLAPTSIVGGAGRGLIIPPPGTMVTDIPNKKVTVGIGKNSYMLVGEDSDLTPVSPEAGWSNAHFYYRRRNGFTYFQGIAQLNASNKAANTPLNVCTLPPEAKPPDDVYCHGFATPGQPFRALIDAASGLVRIVAYAATIPSDATISFQPFSWPSR